MARSGKDLFNWPAIADRQQVGEVDGVLYKLKKPPIPISQRHMKVEESAYVDFLFSYLN